MERGGGGRRQLYQVEILGTVADVVCRLVVAGSSEVLAGGPWAAGLMQSLLARELPLVVATCLVVVVVGVARTSWGLVASSLTF